MLRRLVFGGVVTCASLVILVVVLVAGINASTLPSTDGTRDSSPRSSWDDFLEVYYPLNNPVIHLAMTKAGFISPDFWERAKGMGESLTKYTEDLLHRASEETVAISHRINEFKQAAGGVVSSTNRFRLAIEQDGVGHESIFETFSAALDVILKELQSDF